ncbi:MAG: glycosyltransferase [Elusimicrobia bacterium]|nr:glycosyltransferase [Elusimicrobiota bacterium]
MKVSVNLCCYDSEKYLEETLASVWAQTFTDYELVVINDGSKDGTERIIRAHMEQGRPIVYHPQANAGLGRARNKALELSKGELIAILDHDDVWEPAKLEQQAALFDRAEVGFAGSDAWMMDAKGRLLTRYAARNPMKRGRVLKDLFLNNFIPCAAAMMRRSMIDKAGGFFRPDFHIAEEYELFLRLAEHSEFDYVDEALVRIRVHAASAGWNIPVERGEMRIAYDELLARHPELLRELGEDVVRIKRAGFWIGERDSNLRRTVLSAASRLPNSIVNAALSAKRSLSRLKSR